MQESIMQLIPVAGPASTDLQSAAGNASKAEGTAAEAFEGLLAALLTSGSSSTASHEAGASITNGMDGTAAEAEGEDSLALLPLADAEADPGLQLALAEVEAELATPLQLTEDEVEQPTEAFLPEGSAVESPPASDVESSAEQLPLATAMASVSATASEGTPVEGAVAANTAEEAVAEHPVLDKPVPVAAKVKTTPPPDTGASAPKGADPAPRVVPEAVLKAHGMQPAEEGDDAVTSPVSPEEEGRVTAVRAEQVVPAAKKVVTAGNGRVHAHPQLEATAKQTATVTQSPEQAAAALAADVDTAEVVEEAAPGDAVAAKKATVAPKPAEHALLRAAEHAAVGRIAEGLPEGEPVLKATLVQPTADIAPVSERPAATPTQGVALESTTPQTPTTEARLENLATHTVRNVRYLVSEKGQTITVRLVPESLGSMQLEVQAHQDEISVRLVSTNPMVRETLELNSQGIREALAREGIDVSKVEISATLNQQHAQADTRQGAAHDAAPRAQRAQSFQQFFSGEPAETLEHESYHPKHEGRLNVFV